MAEAAFASGDTEMEDAACAVILAEGRPEPEPEPQPQPPTAEARLLWERWKLPWESEPEPEPESPMRRTAIAGSGFGLTATRRIAAGEVLRREMPIVAAQDHAGQLVSPACLVCLRACGSRQQPVSLALALIGEGALAPQSEQSEGRDTSGWRLCPSCNGLICPDCCGGVPAAAHQRVCGDPAAARLRQLAVTHSDSVWLAALCIAQAILAAEAGEDADAATVERLRWLGLLHRVRWEEIPRWASASIPAGAGVDAFCELRRSVVEETSAQLQSIFPGELTDVEFVSCIMGTLESCSVLPWIRCRQRTDSGSGVVTLPGCPRGPVLLDELVPCIHEAVVREFEAAQVPTTARHWEDVMDRRDEPLWRGIPPIDGAALYPTVGQMNHSCGQTTFSFTRRCSH